MSQLIDVLELEQLETKRTSDGRMVVRGLCQRADIPNRNGRLYTSEVLRREVNRILPEAKRGGVLMLSGHPEKSPELGSVSARLDDLRWKENELFFQATMLNTEAGRNLQELIKSGCKVGVSSRGKGEVTKRVINGKEIGYVNPDYQLRSFDFCIGGSVPGAEITQVVEWEENGDSDDKDEPLTESEKSQLHEALSGLGEQNLSLLNRWLGNEFVPEAMKALVEHFEAAEGEEIELSDEEVGDIAVAVVQDVLGSERAEELAKALVCKTEQELARERNKELTESQRRQKFLARS